MVPVPMCGLVVVAVVGLVIALVMFNKRTPRD
jgi:hypothetical protein